ncbi:hypothetical protein BKE38_27565 [Pseudoroseomonas deserti]|uniref:Carnitine dehydratase n=1 Tax=Teichococcus deserti TaxID=1817963 RepID=A0A1V2GWK2_9PROT|nr:CaiB/BaiF CoA-transferase family protein [Pseudoroseomonas deserti]ONG44675.1 hypothetical protein BKE38_27565 [Pseudoroseomonas deserti]
MSGPLAGLRVLEFSHTIMGPCAGLVLADLGAEVIKVEPAPGGDHTRHLPGFAAGCFATFNRNKRSLAIDLKQPEGRAALHPLVAASDLVLENDGPGTMERLGCGGPALQALNPRLVHLALKGFLAGPYEHRPALDEVVQFQAGLASMTGPPGQPLRAGAWGVYEPFDTAEGSQVFVGVTSDAQWIRFCEAFGLAELAGDERLRTNARRAGARPWLIPRLRAVLAGLPRDSVVARCEAARISWAPVGQPADLFEDAHLLASGGLLDTAISALGGGAGPLAPLPALPVELGAGRARPGLTRQPPRLGEHNAEVLAEAGLLPAEIAALAARGVLAGEPSPANGPATAEDMPCLTKEIAAGG